MKKLILLILCTPVLFLMSSCHMVSGTGPVTTSTRNVSHFNAVESTMSGDTEITIDSVYSVKVEAQKDIIDMIETSVEGDRLVIKTKDGYSINSNGKIIIHVTMPQLTQLQVTGSGNAKILNNLATKSLRLDVSGSGDIETAAVSTEEFEATITGSGNIKVAGGTCKEQKLELTGNGDVDCGNLQAKLANASLTGSGNAKINVSEYLKVSITGSGDLKYSGKPQVTAQVTGSGSLNQSL